MLRHRDEPGWLAAVEHCIDLPEVRASDFLAPAIESVQTLIARYLDISGLARANVGDGDVHGVKIVDGPRCCSARRRRNRRTGLATPYVTLPPAPASIWLNLVLSERRMLWPVLRETNDGIQQIDLVPDHASDRPAHTLYVDALRRSHLDDTRAGEVFKGIEMSHAELERVAAIDPPPPRHR